MTWNIQPVSKSYFNKSIVSLMDVARKRRAGRVIVANRLNPEGTATQVFLIPEGSKPSASIGSLQPAVNLKNKRPYGAHEVLAVIDFKFKDGMLQIDDVELASREYSELLDLTGVAFELVA